MTAANPEVEVQVVEKVTVSTNQHFVDPAHKVSHSAPVSVCCIQVLTAAVSSKLVTNQFSIVSLRSQAIRMSTRGWGDYISRQSCAPIETARNHHTRTRIRVHTRHHDRHPSRNRLHSEVLPLVAICGFGAYVSRSQV